MDQRDSLPRIRAPALVVAGTHDAATPPWDAKLIADAIEGARMVELDAAHISNIEAAGAFDAAIVPFLTEAR
jgi:3-oxoadipate enol-lactonase